jgi:hypothetical protein
VGGLPIWMMWFPYHRNEAAMASPVSKNLVLTGFGAAGLVALAALLDLVLGIPFAGQMTLDIFFLIGAALVGYLAWDAYRDLA